MFTLHEFREAVQAAEGTMGMVSRREVEGRMFMFMHRRRRRGLRTGMILGVKQFCMNKTPLQQGRLFMPTQAWAWHRIGRV